MTSGRTSPALCGCEDEIGSSASEHVVKLRGSVQQRGLFAELLAAKLAAHFGLSSPAPALIVLESALVELIAGIHPAKADLVRGSEGLNFGTQVLIGFATWPVDKQIPDALRPAAVDIFAFDALLQNPDRRATNPNLLTNGETIMVIDHEVAFSFLLDVLPTSTPWLLNRQRYLEEHVFYRRLKSKALDLTKFITRLRALSDAVLDEVLADVPAEWKNEKDELKIRQHLAAIRDHTDEFAEQVRRFLA